MVNVTTYTPFGDKRAALSLRHVGERLLDQVLQEMSWNRIPQLKRTFTISPCAQAPAGAVIQVHSVYGVHNIGVFVPFVLQALSEQETITQLVRLAFVAFHLDMNDDTLDEAYLLASAKYLAQADSDTGSMVSGLSINPELLDRYQWSHNAQKPFIGWEPEIHGNTLIACARSYTYHPAEEETALAFFQSTFYRLDPKSSLYPDPDAYEGSFCYSQLRQYHGTVNQPTNDDWQDYATNFWIDPATNAYSVVILKVRYTPPPDAAINAYITINKYSEKGDILSSEQYNRALLTHTTYWFLYWAHCPLTVAYDGERVYTSLRTTSNFQFNYTQNEVVSNELQSYGGGITRDHETDYDYDPIDRKVVSKYFHYIQERSYTGTLGDFLPEDTYLNSALEIEYSFSLSSGTMLHWLESYVNITIMGPYPPSGGYVFGTPYTRTGHYSFTDRVSGFFPRFLSFYDWLTKQWVFYDLVITQTSIGERRETGYYWVEVQATYRIYDQDGLQVYSRVNPQTGEIEFTGGGVLFSGPLSATIERPPPSDILLNSLTASDSVKEVLQDFMRIHSFGAYQPYGEGPPVSFRQTYHSVEGTSSMLEEPTVSMRDSTEVVDISIKPWRWVTNDKMLVVTEE